MTATVSLPVVHDLPVIEKNETPIICGACRKSCCKAMPGSYHPKQFGPNLEGVAELLRAGLASIDWWDGQDLYWHDAAGKREYTVLEHRGLFLRPAIKPGRRKGEPLFLFCGTPDGDGGVFDPTYGGECVRLVDGKGCSLEFRDRPVNCQGLVANPDPNGHCLTSAEHSKAGMILAWQPFSEALERIGHEVEREPGRAGR